MNKWVLIKKASEMTGYSMSAIYTKIDKGIWPEGKLWRRGPDRRKQINMEEYDRWVESEPILSRSIKNARKKHCSGDA